MYKSYEKKKIAIKIWLTILPEAKINAVVFGSLIRMITAAKRCKNETQ